MRLVDGGGGGGAKCFPVAGWNVAAKPCDSCKVAAALLFCRTDNAFMCMACDVKLHKLLVSAQRHERVWMCEVCEQAPAHVTCKADAAALCVTCDRDIHSANPLSRRHERVPVVPFYETAESIVKTTAETLLVPAPHEVGHEDHGVIGTPVAPSWTLPTANTAKIRGSDIQPDLKSIEFLFSEPDQLLDFDYPIATDNRLHSHFLNPGADSVVPVQLAKPQPPPPAQIIDHSPETRFEIDFTKSNISSYTSSYNNRSLSHSVSSSSMDVGVVPDGSSMSDISYPFLLQMGNGTVDPNGSINGSQATQLATQLSGMDREARVLRYREKRKNRKFEKTIRYASRKAYAETRPRIKGRFAKRTDSAADLEVDRWFTSNGTSKVSFIMGDAEYGVVPSFLRMNFINYVTL